MIVLLSDRLFGFRISEYFGKGMGDLIFRDFMFLLHTRECFYVLENRSSSYFRGVLIVIFLNAFLIISILDVCTYFIWVLNSFFFLQFPFDNGHILDGGNLF